MPQGEPAQQRSGCLYLVATPIGNLEDISLRALRILKETDLIACEDTRQTLKLLSHFEIRKPLESYHEHNEKERAPKLARRMEEGVRIALVSDAGTPVISDPGHRLVSLCRDRGVPVIPIPGPSAIIVALAACGLPCKEFSFCGFLPARVGERKRRLLQLATEPRTIVFYEAPHRVRVCLEDVVDVLGDREVAIAREITKVHEEFLSERASKLLQHFQKTPPRGEITILIAPRDEAMPEKKMGMNAIQPGTLAKRVAQISAQQHFSEKAALKQAAREFGLTKREAYKRLLAEKQS